jgi:peroxiredoxin
LIASEWFESKEVWRRRACAFGLGLLATLFVLARPVQADGAYALLGQAAPDFAAKGVAGENVRLSEHRGEVVVLTFWSGRCNTCRAQLAALDRIAQTYATAGLRVIGVNLDENVRRAQEFARAQNVRFPLLVAPQAGTGRSYRVDSLPMMVIVDRLGKLRAAHREFKARDEALYVRELRALLDE